MAYRSRKLLNLSSAGLLELSSLHGKVRSGTDADVSRYLLRWGHCG
jgi:hypothetical protein